MSNDGLVLTPSLDTISEVFRAPSLSPPMITRFWPTVQTLEPSLSSVRLSGRVTQSLRVAFQIVQLLSDPLNPPQTMFPD